MPSLRSETSEILTSLWYLKRLRKYETEKPYNINLPEAALPPGKQTNEESEEVNNIVINNLRGREQDYSLDRNGFQVFGSAHSMSAVKLQPAMQYEDYASDDKIREHYYPAVIQFLKEALGAASVCPFAHDVRRRVPEFPKLPLGTGTAPQPVQGVHVDMTPGWSEQRLLAHLPEVAAKVKVSKNRWQVLNVWRPLFGPLQEWPLGLCDYQSIDLEEDLIASDNLYPHFISENYNVFYNPSHCWHYLRDMIPDETLVFKTFDSKNDESNARVCVHAAFEDPSSPPDARHRESIECLVLVVYPEDSPAKSN